MSTQEKLRNSEDLNIGQDHADDMFRNHPDLKEMDKKGDSIIADHDAPRGVVNDAEKKAVGDTAAGKAATTIASTAGSPLAGAAVKVLGKIKTKGGAATGIVIALMLLVLVGAGLLAPSAILLRLKEEGTSWMSKYTNIGVNDRLRKVVKARYFDDPSKGTSKIMSRFYPGLDDTEIEKIRSIPGVEIKDSDITERSGKKFLKQMTFNDGGKKITVSGSNFENLHSRNINFRNAFDTHLNAKSFTFRSKFSLKKFSAFDVERAKMLGDKFSQSSILKFFREKFYTAKNLFSLKATGTADNTGGQPNPDQQNALDNLGLQDQADAVRGSDVIANGPSSIIPDASELTPEKAAALTGSTAVGGLKGSLMGVFASLDTGCSIYNTLRIINFGVKLAMAAQLIKYSGLFLTGADKQKASKINTEEIAFLASILLRKGSTGSSKGKDFSQSQGASLIFDGKVSRPTDLARFSLGNVATQALSALFTVFNFGSIGPSACSKILSWWGQSLLFLGGIVTSIATFGTGAASGIAVGAAKGLAIAFIMQVMTPRIIPLIAGTVIPDPKKDPEGGYGAGNAIAAGIGAFGGQLGRGKGMRPLTKTQFAALQNSQEASMMAKTETYRYNQMGVMNLDNPRSLPNLLAYNLSGFNQPQSLWDYVDSAQTLVAKALSTPIDSASAASPDDEYRGKFCADADTYAVMKTDVLPDGKSLPDFARDANCNIIYGPDPLTLDNVKYSLDNTVSWMTSNGYVDPDTLEAKGEYKDYKDTCTDGIEPIIDFYGADLSEGTNIEQCFNTDDDKYRYFSAYTSYDDAASATDDAANDKLGYADESTASTIGATNPTGGTSSSGGLVGGDAQSLAKQIISSGKVSGDSRYMGQIQAYANGNTSCHINPTILSIIATIMQKHTIYITSLNRYCTGVLTASGASSYHYTQQGGHAVDIGSIDGAASSGGNPRDITMLNEIMSSLPSGSGIGQSNCRSTPLALGSGVREFFDTCNHVHIQVPIQ